MEKCRDVKSILTVDDENCQRTLCPIPAQMEDVDNETIKPWLERAESVFPKSDPKSSVIFQLREKMIKEIQNKSVENGAAEEDVKTEGETQLQVGGGGENVCWSGPQYVSVGPSVHS